MMIAGTVKGSLFYITEACPYDLEITCLTLVIVSDVGLHFLKSVSFFYG